MGNKFIKVFDKASAERLSREGLRVIYTDGRSWTFINNELIPITFMDKSKFTYTDKLEV